MSSQPVNTTQVPHSPATVGLPCRDLVSIRDLRRTRLTFEAGMASMGGWTSFVDQTQGRLDAREKLSDIAHNLERWVDGIILRTFAHSTVEGMAEHACIPVINALSELEHPCQALADYFTLHERFGDLKNITLAYVGDGNNVAHSLLLTCSALGAKIRIATPPGYGPNAQIVADAYEIAVHTGAKIEILTDPHEAVFGVDAVYTDAWTSMGHGPRRTLCSCTAFLPIAAWRSRTK